MEENLKFWEKIAFLYTSMMDKYFTIYNEMSETIYEYLEDEMSVLEVGCGTGQMTVRLGDAVSSWLATDFSEKMIEIAIKSFPDCSAKYELADVNRLQYPDEAFDVVVCANVMTILTKPEQAMKEISRVLKSGGLLICPNIVHDDQQNLILHKLRGFIGYREYNHWTSSEYERFIKSFGFTIEYGEIYKYDDLDECLIIARK